MKFRPPELTLPSRRFDFAIALRRHQNGIRIAQPSRWREIWLLPLPVISKHRGGSLHEVSELEVRFGPGCDCRRWLTIGFECFGERRGHASHGVFVNGDYIAEQR